MSRSVKKLSVLFAKQSNLLSGRRASRYICKHDFYLMKEKILILVFSLLKLKLTKKQRQKTSKYVAQSRISMCGQDDGFRYFTFMTAQRY